MNTASAPETTGAESLRARETLKSLYGYVRPHRWAVALGLLCALTGAAGGLLQPPATKTLVDRLSSGGTIGTVLLMSTVPVLLSTVAEAFGVHVLERTAESVVLAARRSLIGSNGTENDCGPQTPQGPRTDPTGREPADTIRRASPARRWAGALPRAAGTGPPGGGCPQRPHRRAPCRT